MTVPFPRTVKPRKVTPQDFRPIILVHDGTVLLERSGEVFPQVELATRLGREPSSIVVTTNSGGLTRELTVQLGDDPLWQYRVAPFKREYVSWVAEARKRGKRVQTLDTIVTYFGYRSLTKKPGHWHYPLDPTVFTRLKMRTLLFGDGDTWEQLFAWGKDVREFCQEQQLKISPTSGGLAGQLLRDPRFYPEVRRKIPKATNARARASLPGNFYRLYYPENTVRDAIYLDMRAAHHHAALDTVFPNSNGLLARGNFRNTDTTDTTVSSEPAWKRSGTPGFHSLLRSHGLLRLRLDVPRLRPQDFPLPYLETSGRKTAWVYTNELPYLDTLGVLIEGVDAAWTAYETDSGLNRYAAWALAELATMDNARKQWAKPALLAAYGILAARPQVREFAYRIADGIPRHYPVNGGTLPAFAHRGNTPQETPTCNVIHRGMIEAETRLRCLRLARDLTAHNCTVLAIYADAVFVAAGDPLPLLPHPWDVKNTLHRLRFLNPTSFTSTELTRLPGVPQYAREREQRLASVRRGL